MNDDVEEDGIEEIDERQGLELVGRGAHFYPGHQAEKEGRKNLQC